MRITRSDPHLPQVARGSQMTVHIDGQPAVAFAGETVAAVLLAQGIRTFRHTSQDGRPRGIYCGMGICYDCIVTVDGVTGVRACQTLVTPGMRIVTQQG